MSGIIKSGSHAELASVRALGTPPPVSVVPMPRKDEERERLRRTVAALESDLRRRDAVIDGLRKDVERAFEGGKAQGREAGLAEARDLQAERLAALEATLREVRTDISAGLGALDRLAALLARDCVEMILGGAEDRAELIARIVGTQVERIDKAMLLGIEVARADFPDDTALAALAERLAPLSVALAADPELPQGGCVMILRLGRMSVGIDQQWGALDALLGRMALPEAAA